MADERELRVASVWVIEGIEVQKLREQICALCPDARLNYSADEDILSLKGPFDSDTESAVVDCIRTFLATDKPRSSHDDAHKRATTCIGAESSQSEPEIAGRDNERHVPKDQDVPNDQSAAPPVIDMSIQVSRTWAPSNVQASTIYNKHLDLLIEVAAATGTTISLDNSDSSELVINVSARAHQRVEDALKRLGNLEKMIVLLQTPLHAHTCYCPSTNGLRFGVIEHGQFDKGSLQRILLDPDSPVKGLIGNLTVPASCRIDPSTNAFHISRHLRDSGGIPHPSKTETPHTIKCLSKFKFTGIGDSSEPLNRSIITGSTREDSHTVVAHQTESIKDAKSVKGSQAGVTSRTDFNATHSGKVSGPKVRRAVPPGGALLKTASPNEDNSKLAESKGSKSLFRVIDMNDDEQSGKREAASPADSQSTSRKREKHSHPLQTREIEQLDCEDYRHEVKPSVSQNWLDDSLTHQTSQPSCASGVPPRISASHADISPLLGSSESLNGLYGSSKASRATSLLADKASDYQQVSEASHYSAHYLVSDQFPARSSSRTEAFDIASGLHGSLGTLPLPSVHSLLPSLAASTMSYQPTMAPSFYPQQIPQRMDGNPPTRESTYGGMRDNQTVPTLRNRYASRENPETLVTLPNEAHAARQTSDQLEGRRWNSDSTSLPRHNAVPLNTGHSSFWQGSYRRHYDQETALAQSAYSLGANATTARPGYGFTVTNATNLSGVQPSYVGSAVSNGPFIIGASNQCSQGSLSHYSGIHGPPAYAWPCPCGRTLPYPWQSPHAANWALQGQIAWSYPQQYNFAPSYHVAQPSVTARYQPVQPVQPVSQTVTFSSGAHFTAPGHGSYMPVNSFIPASFAPPDNQRLPFQTTSTRGLTESSLAERMASSQSTDRQFHSVMNQRTANPSPAPGAKKKAGAGTSAKASKKRWKPLDISYTSKATNERTMSNPHSKGVTPLQEDPGLTQKARELLAPLLETARVFPGSLRLEIQLGMVAILRTSGAAEAIFVSFQDINDIIHSSRHVSGPSTIFFHKLTTSPVDIDHMLDATAGGARLFENEPSMLDISYEFHCVPNSGEVRVIAFDEMGRYKRQGSDVMLGSMNISYPDRIWDAAVVLRGSLDAPKVRDPATLEMIKTISTTLWVEPNCSRMRLRIHIEGSTFSVKKIVVRRKTLHRCVVDAPEQVTGDAGGLFLQVTEVQDLVISPCQADPSVLEATCKSFDEMAKLHRQWWEVSIISPAINHALGDRSSSGIGEVNPLWNPVDLLGTQDKSAADRLSSKTAKSIGRYGLGALLGLATAVLENLDVVGYSNCAS
ncbi:Uncharacterized protein PECH_001933 [Penicillium ucsense]|uniref:Uncharacterized protein n=1 Tax=Penicillium ucsense TaxID=2839758 RepID=A0A8J8WIL9_9EURO|nr:Uncharacterized protein PECM_008421 [Penicillium ucsense]KAF7731495.1 Uncharacterized protein PECH_001933 [Penicillium ucsense]